MSSYRPPSPAFSPYSPFNPANQQAVTSDYIVGDQLQSTRTKLGAEKEPSTWNHEMQPLSGAVSVHEEKETQHAHDVDDSPYKILSRKERNRVIFHAVRFVLVTVLVAIILCIPLWIFQSYRDVGVTTDDGLQQRNLVWWLFSWFLSTWLIACFFNFIALIFPYLFWVVAKFVNPAHRRYWRIFRPLRFPFTLLGLVLGSIMTFGVLIYDNDLLAFNNSQDQSAIDLFSNLYIIVDDIQWNLLAWSLLYLFEKILMMYITIHYHYRSDSVRIESSKNMLAALSSLYETSTYLDPVYSKRFQTEDIIIRNASLSGGGKSEDAAKFFQRVGGMGAKAMSVVGSATGKDGKSHWFKAASTYATIEHALENPKSAAALAQRIWTSLATEGKDVLTVDDIAEAFGPHRKEEAQQIFSVLDENENGDIQLEEMVQTVVEACRTRVNIYAGMQDINHAINTFEWVVLLVIALAMIFLILTNYFPPVQKVKDILGFSALGLSFALGRTVHDFISGATFVFFKHAFDIGDRVDLFNIAENNVVCVTVKRISLLYCIFQRCDDGKIVQFPTQTLCLKRIENVSRSGLNSEKVSLFIDINTSFKDIEFLRAELKSFLSQRENTRDYKPDVVVRVKSVHELNKLELGVVFTHKSNWHNEGLRSARSSKFMCALIAALRRVPIGRPGPPPPKLGSEERPNYTVFVTDAEAAEMRNADDLKAKKKRFDFEEEAEVTDDEEDVGEGLAKKRKEEKKARDKEAEKKAREAIGAIPPALAAKRKERATSNANGDDGNATGVDGSSFRRLLGDAGAEEFVHEHGLGGRRRRVDIGGQNTGISGPFYNTDYGRPRG